MNIFEYIAQGVGLAAYATAMVGVVVGSTKGNLPEFDMSDRELKRRQRILVVKRLRYHGDFAGRLASLNPNLVRRMK